MQIKAKVVFHEIEGGFWGLVGDDGQRYEPIDALPVGVQSDGCLIEADLEPVDRISYRQWGRPVRVRRANRL